MEFTTTHLQCVKITTHFLAKKTINNLNQPLKTEFNQKSHILMGSKKNYPEISSQIKYNF